MFTQFPLRKAVALAALAVCMQAPQAAILNFDDLVSLDPAVPERDWFTSDYMGFRFGTNDTMTTAWFFSSELNAFYGPSSPTQYASTDFQIHNGTLFEPTQSITAAVDFRFDGAKFAGFDQVRYQLYNNGVLVHTSADSPVLTNTPVFVASGYAGLIDEVVVLGSQGFFAMDDFTYEPSTAVPEPAGLALVLTAGLAGAAAMRRRNSKR